jgi:hypothetical protein
VTCLTSLIEKFKALALEIITTSIRIKVYLILSNIIYILI